MSMLIPLTATPPQHAVFSEELLARYIAFLDVSPKSIETYKRAVKQFLFFLRDEGITAPQREHVILWREMLRITGRKPNTIQNYIVAVRGFFAWLEQERIYTNIAERVKGAKIDKSHKKDYLTAHQVRSILAHIDRATLRGARDYALLLLLFTCGLRTIEAARACVGDIRVVGDDTVLYVQGKGQQEKAAAVRLTPPVEDAIRAYLIYRGELPPFAALFASTSNNSFGESLSTRSISGIVKTRMIDAGFNSDRLTAHSTRHTAVTLALLAGRELAEVQQFARHANIQTTLIYSHALDEAKNGCSSAITDKIFADAQQEGKT